MTIAFVLLASVALKAQNATETQQPADPKSVMKFKHLEWDFGNVIEGEKPTHEFEFANAGKTPIIITSAQPSCGCTTPDWSKEPIQPGKNGKVTAQYNSEGKAGVFNKTITVKTNVGDIVLTIKGNVIKKDAQPSSPVIQH